MARHPGEVLRQDFMAPLGLTASRLAALAGVSEQTVYQLLAGKRSVSPAMARRLGVVFRMRPHHWLAWQADWDLARLEVPTDASRAELAGFVTGPKGAVRLPEAAPTKPVDTRFSPELQQAVMEAAAIVERALHELG